MKRVKPMRCPVCGKKPKLRHGIAGTTIACKPFIGKAHISAKVNHINLLNFGSDVNVVWNTAVSNYITGLNTTNHTINDPGRNLINVGDKRLKV